MTSTTVQMATETTVVQVVDGEATVVQTGVPVTVTTTGGGGGVTDATYVTLSTNGTLTDERVLTAGTGITITDAGAGSTVTVGVTANTYQPLDSDLTAIAALSTTSFGRALLELADAAAGRTALGLGSLATASTITTSEITDGTIVNADISASAAIATSKISGLGGAATLNVGTSAGTVAAGDDSRITGAVPKSTVTAKGDLIVATASGTVTNRAVGSDGQALVAESGNSAGLMWADVIPWHQHLMLGDGIYKSAVGTWAVAAASVVAGAQFNNAASQAINDELQFDVVLSEGTWSVNLTYGKTAAAGIITFYLDATSLGTIDAYNGSSTNNNVSTISGISVTTTGKYVLKLKLESKNASASAYRATLQQLTLRRTA